LELGAVNSIEGSPFWRFPGNGEIDEVAQVRDERSFGLPSGIRDRVSQHV
jgi:hypothetical protein